MAFTVQNDAGTVEDANAYITVAFADSYFLDRNITTWTGTDAQKEYAIIKATDYIDKRFKFLGIKRLPTQTTEFPRINLYDSSGYEVGGIFAKLKYACCEYALRALTTPLTSDPTYDSDGNVILSSSESAGGSGGTVSESYTYAEGAKVIYKAYPAADGYLKQFIISTGTVNRG